MPGRFFLSLFILTPGLFFGTINPAHAEDVDHISQYRVCMNTVQTDPKKAFTIAIRWRDLGGGEAADHCTAAALIGLEQYREGAVRMEELALRSRQNPEMKAQILIHAVQGWLLAGDALRSEAVATTAIKLLGDFAPQLPELLIDRAQARAQLRDYKGALEDLDKSILTQPTDADAFAFRASAKRYLNDIEGAILDANSALNINSAHADALLERGILHRLNKADQKAREDWLMVLSVAPESLAAEAARVNLEKMDVKKE